jgi:hypothetical protein
MPRRLRRVRPSNLSADQFYVATCSEIQAYLDFGHKLVTVVITFEFAVATLIAGIVTSLAGSDINAKRGVYTIFGLPMLVKYGILTLLFAAIVVPLLAQFTLNRAARRVALLRTRQHLISDLFSPASRSSWPADRMLNESEDNSIAYVHCLFGMFVIAAYAGLCGWWRGAFFGIIRGDYDKTLILSCGASVAILIGYFYLWRRRVLGQIGIESRNRNIAASNLFLRWLGGVKHWKDKQYDRDNPIPE